MATLVKKTPCKPQMLKAGVIWLIGTDGSGHNELASCVPSRRSMPINQMTPSMERRLGDSSLVLLSTLPVSYSETGEVERSVSIAVAFTALQEGI
ncbi:hypothetical protein TYRP_019397 [Tyrophagus putrescentiae]|nr:hypothetical protein TYRP_019397 [Tyrophagus putrescentiae]